MTEYNIEILYISFTKTIPLVEHWLLESVLLKIQLSGRTLLRFPLIRSRLKSKVTEATTDRYSLLHLFFDTPNFPHNN